MVQGDDPLEVNSEYDLDEDDAMSYDNLTVFCQKLLERYDVLKVENKSLKKENMSLLNENDSSKSSIVLKENEFLKRKNIFFSSKLNVIFEGNNCLKN